jgi:hypothetical protein
LPNRARCLSSYNNNSRKGFEELFYIHNEPIGTRSYRFSVRTFSEPCRLLFSRSPPWNIEGPYGLGGYRRQDL